MMLSNAAQQLTRSNIMVAKETSIKLEINRSDISTLKSILMQDNEGDTLNVCSVKLNMLGQIINQGYALDTEIRNFTNIVGKQQ